MEQEADKREVDRRLAEFYSHIDLDCKPSYGVSSTRGLPFSLTHSFRSLQEIKGLAKSVQDLKGSYSTESQLMSVISNQMERKPLMFMFFMHLFRNKRFTNVELVDFMFDRKKLDNVEYYRGLVQSSRIFRSKVQNALRREPWKSQIASMKEKDKSKVLWSEHPEDERLLLAIFKKAVSMYLDNERTCGAMWLERVRDNSDVRERTAKFLVKNENLRHVIESDMIDPLFHRNVSALNVEEIKAKRGRLGSRKVEKILIQNDFERRDFESTTVKGIEEELRTGNHKEPFMYGVEKRLATAPGERGKILDFVLCSQSGVEFVIETNYYTTSMSKIREVVDNFKRLSQACNDQGYPLIYITDGVGWFRLMKPVREMIEFDFRQMKSNRDRGVPFLMNIGIFDDWVSRIKDEFG